MNKYIFFLILCFNAKPTNAFEFSEFVDEVNTLVGTLRVADLGVGEFGFIHRSSFCHAPTGELMIIGSSELESGDVFDYGSSLEVKRLPRSTVSIKIIPGAKTNTEKERVSLVKHLVNTQSMLSCKVRILVFGEKMSDMFSIQSIDGKTNLRELTEGLSF